MPQSDQCKPVHQGDATDIRNAINGIVCTNNPEVNGIERDYERIKKRFKGLQEALGDKIRTFVALRGGGAQDINLDIPGSKVSWGGKNIKFSGVFDATKSNVDKYWEVKELLDNVHENESTVVIFGYGYSGSGKTYTLLGKKGSASNLATQIQRRSDGLAKLNRLKQLLSQNPVPVVASRSVAESAARSQESEAAQNASQQVIQFLTAARDILKRDEETLGVDGVTQLAIQAYINDGCQVKLEKAFEMYNDTYKFIGGFNYDTKTEPIDFSIPNYGSCYRRNEDIPTVDMFNEIYDKITKKRI
jgi:hypothetical protein